MPTLTREHRRAMALIASSPGYTTRALQTHGIGLNVLADLAEARLISMHTEPVVGGSSGTALTRVQLTDAGRAELPKS